MARVKPPALPMQLLPPRHGPTAGQDTALADEVAAADRLVRAGHIEEALAACEALLPRLEASGDALQQGICYHVMLLAHQYAGRVKESAVAGYRALELFGRLDAVERMVRSLGLQALSVARLGDVGETLVLLERAIVHLPSLQAQPYAQCVFWNNAGAAYQALGKFRQASEAAEHAQRLTRDFDEPVITLICACNLLMCRIGVARQQQAAGESNELPRWVVEMSSLVDTLHKQGRLHLVAQCAQIAAEGWIDLGQLDAARSLLLRAMPAVQATGALPERGALHLRLAEVERRAGRPRAAARHIDAALTLLTEGQDKGELVRAHLEKSRQHEARRRWRDALESYKCSTQMREELLKAEADSRAQVMAIRLDLERTRAEAASLRQRNVELEGDMTRLSVAADELQRLALEDPLTGLANRRQLTLGLQALRSRYPQEPLMLVVIDIDHFKRINDTLSHAVGDAVLSQLGRLLQHLSRPDDVVARVGGEEFVIAFGGPVSIAGALHVAERMRCAIERHDWHAHGCTLPVTASMGAAAWTFGEALQTALERADRALYRSKAAGRNRVHYGE